jgi:hypothetical protein
MGKTFNTPGGTVLPISDIKGKDYLEVKYRLVWFREVHPLFTIETTIVNLSEKAAVVKAVIKDETGRVLATSHKSETEKGFFDFMEKAETGAIGRALALLGFGTQFCADELDEGERIVDSPKDRNYSVKGDSPKFISNNNTGAEDWVVDFGKFKNIPFSKIPAGEAKNYADFLRQSAVRNGKPMGKGAAHFVHLAQSARSQPEDEIPPHITRDDLPF